MITIIDYGVGNLFSLKSSFTAIGVEAVVSDDPEILWKSEKLILPGVGAFEDAARKLRETGLDEVVKSAAQAGTPILGICLGMQMLFDKSYEFGIHQGLGLIPGEIVPIRDVIPEYLKVPHIGWNSLKYTKESPLFRYISDGDYVYFVHSYYASGCAENTIAVSEYGAELTAAVQNGNVFGCQFHPEKSGEVGLKILKAFAELEVKAC